MTKSIFMTIVFLGYLGLTFFYPDSYKPTITIVLSFLLAGYSYLEYHKKTDYSEIFDEKLKKLEEKHQDEITKLNEKHIEDYTKLESKVSTIQAGNIRNPLLNNQAQSKDEVTKIWGL